MNSALQLFPLRHIPLVVPGDDLVQLFCDAVAGEQLQWQDDDLLVIAQKIVSKAEGRYRCLDEISASAEAVSWANRVDKDPRLVQLILDESVAVLRHRPGAMIVEHRLGYVHANAGIDVSNLPGDGRVLLLPEDPDRSARQLHEALRVSTACHVNVLIIDSAGRAWRNGLVGFTLGSAGFAVLESRIGDPDLFGRPLAITEVAVADELAPAASHLMGQGAEAIPAVLVRGARLTRSEQGSTGLIRARAQDLFR